MYVIFVHVTGIALVEILFYFLYVGPIESNVFENLMKSIVNREIKDNNLEIINKISGSDITFDDDTLIEDISLKKEEGQQRRESHNKDLYNEAMEYWGYLLLITFIVSLCQLIIYLYYNKYNKKQIIKVDSEQSLELMNIRIRNDSVNSDDLNFLYNDSESNEPIDDLEANDKFIIIRKKLTWKYILKKFLYYSFFIGLLLAFEFGFFQLIVFNYMPLSPQEVEYIVYKAIYDYF